jgi:hypothetical protein
MTSPAVSLPLNSLRRMQPPQQTCRAICGSSVPPSANGGAPCPPRTLAGVLGDSTSACTRRRIPVCLARPRRAKPTSARACSGGVEEEHASADGSIARASRKHAFADESMVRCGWFAAPRLRRDRLERPLRSTPVRSAAGGSLATTDERLYKARDSGGKPSLRRASHASRPETAATLAARRRCASRLENNFRPRSAQDQT